jgi:hypothetical protein
MKMNLDSQKFEKDEKNDKNDKNISKPIDRNVKYLIKLKRSSLIKRITSNKLCCFCCVPSIILFSALVLIFAIIFAPRAIIDAIRVQSPPPPPTIIPEINSTFLLPPSHREFINDLNPNFILNRLSPCDDFYSHSCGNFSIVSKSRDEMFNIVQYNNNLRKTFIDQKITEGNQLLCVDGQNINGCKSSLQYYQKCFFDRSLTHTDFVNKLVNQMLFNFTTVFSRLRFLIENDIISYISLTKEMDPENSDLYIHYLRPGGVLLSDNGNVNEMEFYGEDGLIGKQAVRMTIREFLRQTSLNWIEVFGEHALGDDSIIVENIQYFENLNDYIRRTHISIVSSRLELFIRQTFNVFRSKDCLVQTKLLFPMTFCRIFKLFGLLEDNEINEDLENIAYGILNTTRTIFPTLQIGKDVEFRLATCSGLLHSKNIGDKLLEIESNSVFYSNMTSFEWAHEFMMKKFYSLYNPIWLYYTYPRILDITDYNIDDPLDWYSQVNAFFDSFSNEIVIPPGIVMDPIYNKDFSFSRKISNFGYIIAHEIAHTFQNQVSSKYLDCYKNQLGEINFVGKMWETNADVIGLSSSFVYYLENKNETSVNCNYFYSYAQMFCSMNPTSESDFIHGTSMERVNIPINSGGFLDYFNECFNCTKKSLC